MIGTINKNTKYQIDTPEGFKDFHGIIELEPLRTLKFYLENNDSISVSFNHVFNIDGVEYLANKVIEGFVLETKTDGLQKIIKIEESETEDKIFELLDVKSKGHLYYADNILNHNCQFLGSSNTLIDPSLLERIELKNPVELKLGSYLNVYEQPIDGAMYILGVDSAKGTGKDYSVIQVLKIVNEHDIEQVGLYRNNQIEAREFAQVCISVSKFFNDAYMMVENNDVGETVAHTIWYEYEYDKILNCDVKGIGIRSTKKSKLAANLLLKRYMENGWLGICDRNTLYELSRYEEVRPNVFQAGRDKNDDCVTSLLWGLFFVTTLFFDGKNVDIKKIDSKFLLDKHADDMDMPIFVSDDEEGLDEGWGYTDEGDDPEEEYY